GTRCSSGTACTGTCSESGSARRACLAWAAQRRDVGAVRSPLSRSWMSVGRSLIRFGTALDAGKTSKNAPLSYRPSPLRRNEGGHDLLVEAPAGQQAGGCRRRSAARDEGSSALSLGVQRAQRGFELVRADAGALEVEPDRRIALSLPRQHTRALVFAARVA